MVLKQKGKPEKGKKPVRGGPKEFSDLREFPDGPRESSGSENEHESSDYESGSSGSESEVEQVLASLNKASITKPSEGKPASKPAPASTSSAPREMSRRDREAIQKEQARQHYMKMKEKEDSARLAIIRKQREEAAAKHAEELRAKEAARRRP